MLVLPMTLLDAKKITFTDIYSNYYQVVFGVIYSKIASTTDADELTQEVFMRFYSKMDEVKNVRAWLFGTMRNVLLNFFKKKKNLNSEDISDYLDDASISFVNGFRDTRIIIDEAIGRLSEHDRLLFDLIAVQNYTYDKAAKHLGLTKRHAKYRYYCIIREIRFFLNAKGIRNIEDLL